MSKLTTTVALASLLLATTAWAGPEHPEHEGHEKATLSQSRASMGAKSLAAKTTTRESVTPELAKIVVLCANEQEKQFEKEWKQYVDKHGLKGPELNETIAWVSTEAAHQRKAEGKLKNDKDEAEWAEKRRDFMRQVADRALNPAR